MSSLKEIKDLDSLLEKQKNFLTNQLKEITGEDVTFNDVKLYKEITKDKNVKEYAQKAINNNSVRLYRYFLDKYGG